MDGKNGKNSPRKLPPWLLVESSWVVVFPSTHPNTYFHHRQESAVIPHKNRKPWVQLSVPHLSRTLTFALKVIDDWLDKEIIGFEPEEG